MPSATGNENLTCLFFVVGAKFREWYRSWPARLSQMCAQPETI